MLNTRHQPEPPGAAHDDRLAGVRDAMNRAELDVLVLWPSANWRYLVPFAPVPIERASFLFVTRTSLTAVVPDFDAAEVKELGGVTDVHGWSDMEGPHRALAEAWKIATSDGGVSRVGIDDDLPFFAWTLIESHAAGATGRALARSSGPSAY